MLDKCQKTLDRLTENILVERNEKVNIQKEMLDEYKQIRRIYEEMTDTIKEQLITANNLRRERNELLRELVSRKTE